MQKAEHGKRLKEAMAQRDISNATLAGLVNVGKKTVYNWRQGVTMPDDADRAKLRHWLPGYDAAGDPVEVALAQSELTEDRRHIVLAAYKRQLREQSERNVS